MSVGVSFNKVFAKLASDLKKPDATSFITPENFRSVVWPLDVRALLYVGPATQRRLLSRNIRTIGGLAACSPEALFRLLGKHGRTLWAYANGLDCDPVAPLGESAQAKSVGNSITPPRDLVSDADAREVIAILSQSVGERLLRKGLAGQTVSVSIRSSALKTVSAQRALAAPTAISREIEAAATALFRERWDWRTRVRSLGVCVSALSPLNAPQQLCLFDDGARDRALALERELLALRARYGPMCVRSAALLRGDFGALRPHAEMPAFVRDGVWQELAANGGAAR